MFTIYESLSFLTNEINKFLNQRLGPTTNPRLVLENIAKNSDIVTGDNYLLNKIVLSLLNVEEDNVANKFNFYILIAAKFSTYSDDLKAINLITQFFQSNKIFTPVTNPGLDERIVRINVDLYNLKFEEINHIWSVLGNKYIPSIMYKVKVESILEI